MTLEDVLENVEVTAFDLGSGEYFVTVSGIQLNGDPVDLQIKLTGCITQQLLNDTLRSKLEEIFECKYNYIIDNIDEDEILYDGGTFK